MNRKTRWLVPEVIQTSNMDCGPASLKCLLEGFGVSVHYGHLRDACQTDVDGTSINTLERVAVELGLDAAQMVVPKDHLLLNAPGYLPGMVVVRLPNGNTHFVVAWRNHGGVVQLMDPASGSAGPARAVFSTNCMSIPCVCPRRIGAAGLEVPILSIRCANVCSGSRFPGRTGRTCAGDPWSRVTGSPWRFSMRQYAC